MRADMGQSIKAILAKAASENQWEFICSAMDDTEMDHSACDNAECEALFQVLYDASSYVNFNQFLCFLLEKAKEYQATQFADEIVGKILQRLNDIQDQLEKNNFKLNKTLLIELLTCLDFSKSIELHQFYLFILAVPSENFLTQAILNILLIVLLKLQVQMEDNVIKKAIFIIGLANRNQTKSLISTALPVEQIIENACENYMTYYQAMYGKMPISLGAIDAKIIAIVCADLHPYPMDWMPLIEPFFADFIARKQKPVSSIFDAFSAFYSKEVKIISPEERIGKAIMDQVNAHGAYDPMNSSVAALMTLRLLVMHSSKIKTSITLNDVLECWKQSPSMLEQRNNGDVLYTSDQKFIAQLSATFFPSELPVPKAMY